MELISTEDGSLTARDSHTNELYHNRAGAYSEALYNYVRPSDACRRLENGKQIKVLDVCFGLGYNTFVLIEQCIAGNVKGDIEILAIENDEAILACLESVLLDPRFSRLAENLSGDLLRDGQLTVALDGLKCCIKLLLADVRQCVPSLSGNFDFVFHDPFSARHVPQLWTYDLFAQYNRLLLERCGAVLTYSSAVAVRSGLARAGFELYRTTAVGGKNGGTMACISGFELTGNECVDHLSAVELSKLESPSAVPYRDPSFSAQARVLLKNRQDEMTSRPEKRNLGFSDTN